MTISVRPVCYESDSQALIDTLQTNLPHLPHARLFPWLYLQNPEGPALAWVATDSETSRIIGVAAAFPRRVYYRGEEVRSYVLGDFCIDAGHRSLGVALSLQRACLEGLSTCGAGFAFDFPSATMLAIYKRLRIEVNATMVRYAKPLRVDRKVAERIPVRAVARGLSAVANAGLRLRGDGAGRDDDYTVVVEPGPWTEEFTEAAHKWSSGTGVCVVRDATYLNWRYGEHPEQHYKMLVARKGASLCGYLIRHVNGEGFTIDDLFAENNAARRALLAEATAVARQQPVQTVSMPWLAAHAGTSVLEQCGFRPRESSPVVVLPLGTQPSNGPTEDQWFLTSGDWES